MSSSGRFRALVWFAAFVGAGMGLFWAWTVRPTFLFTPITADSIFRSVPDHASAGMQALSFVGMGVISLIHFTMWVGGSAAVTVVGTVLLHELVWGR